MKKLKTLLCLGLVAVAGCLGLVGCGPNNSGNNNNDTNNLQSITIAQAQQYLTDGLKTDGQDNVNVLAKFGKFYCVSSVSSTIAEEDGTSRSSNNKQDLWVQMGEGGYTAAIWDTYEDNELYLSLYSPNATDMYSKMADIDEHGNISYEYGKSGEDTFYPQGGISSMLQMNITVIETMCPVNAKLLGDMYTDGGISKTTRADGSFDVKVVLDAAKYAATTAGVTPENFEEMKEDIHYMYPDVNTYAELIEQLKQASAGVTVQVIYSYSKTGSLTKLEFSSVGTSTISDGQSSATMFSDSRSTITPYTGNIVAPEWVNDTNFPPEQD